MTREQPPRPAWYAPGMRTIRLLTPLSVLTIVLACGGVIPGDAPTSAPASAAPAAAPKTGQLIVAVLPFANNSGAAEWDPLGKGLADMMTTDLARSSSLTVIERERLSDVVQEIGLQQTSMIDAATAQKVGQLLGASHLAFGSLVALDPDLRLDVRLVGVGTGMPSPGGLGSWALEVGGFTVGAVAAVNAVGSVVGGKAPRAAAGSPGPSTAAGAAGPQDGAGSDGLPATAGAGSDGLPATAGQWRGQTTLVAVATDAPLDRARCRVLAKMAAAGMARALQPAFTPFDGDVVFAFSTVAGDPVDNVVLAGLGDAAATCVATAIRRAVGRD